MASSRGRVLVVDHDTVTRMSIEAELRQLGFSIETAADGFKALRKLGELPIDVVLSDVELPGMDGLGLLEKIREGYSVRVVLRAKAPLVDQAVASIKQGADNYLPKETPSARLAEVLDQAVARAWAWDRGKTERSPEATRAILGSHAVTCELRARVLEVSQRMGHVLITGETGTGKELVIEALHRASPRAKRALVRFHCGQFADTHFERHLFGYERGAFPGALSRREAGLKQADGGTLVLDEVADAPESVQARLIRLLETSAYYRVGGEEELSVDVRVVATTRFSVSDLIAARGLRPDLVHRLAEHTVAIPPLAERGTDILELAAHFARREAAEMGCTFEGITESAAELLSGYNWPGNVRELRFAIKEAMQSSSGWLDARNLPAKLATSQATKGAVGMPPVPGTPLEELEKFAILRTLESCGGSTSRAAKILGISARKIQYKLHEYSEQRGDT